MKRFDVEMEVSFPVTTYETELIVKTVEAIDENNAESLAIEEVYTDYPSVETIDVENVIDITPEPQTPTGAIELNGQMYVPYGRGVSATVMEINEPEPVANRGTCVTDTIQLNGQDYRPYGSIERE
jgi:hypothetical protein